MKFLPSIIVSSGLIVKLIGSTPLNGKLEVESAPFFVKSMIANNSPAIIGSPSRLLIPGELDTVSTSVIATPLLNSELEPSLNIITLSSWPVLEIVELRPSAMARRDTMTATEPAIPIIITNEDPDLSRMDLRFILVTDKTCLIKLILIFP